jgi:N-methylhydantoinase B/oxoprolinase/acetone carboxylase alpha subunit
MLREYEFREPVSLSFFGSRRTQAPYDHSPHGVQHGGPRSARPGTQWITIGGSTIERPQSVLSLEFAPGDRFGVATPGGGSYSP